MRRASASPLVGGDNNVGIAIQVYVTWGGREEEREEEGGREGGRREGRRGRRGRGEGGPSGMGCAEAQAVSPYL